MIENLHPSSKEWKVSPWTLVYFFKKESHVAVVVEMFQEASLLLPTSHFQDHQKRDRRKWSFYLSEGFSQILWVNQKGVRNPYYEWIRQGAKNDRKKKVTRRAKDSLQSTNKKKRAFTEKQGGVGVEWKRKSLSLFKGLKECNFFILPY